MVYFAARPKPAVQNCEGKLLKGLHLYEYFMVLRFFFSFKKCKTGAIVLQRENRL